MKRVTQKMSCFLDENDVVMSEHELGMRVLELQEMLDEAKSVVEFYHEWCRDDLHCDFICAEPTDKRARQWLSKYGGEV
jgi:hypothetical protein